jgi:hypothetical protein
MSDPTGDLRQCWVQLSHIKRAKGWSTMGVYVYDPGMQSLLTIAVCEFLNEKHDSQVLFWTLLNNACLKKGVHVNFRGFMADDASANWRAVREVYKEGRTNVMEKKERTCDFH